MMGGNVTRQLFQVIKTRRSKSFVTLPQNEGLKRLFFSTGYFDSSIQISVTQQILV